ncbi:all-trans retinoic acid-induced differentiation factor [Tiliqua scincoides]|uniref:all-trans retinoic acid-induced differentiation factor n=1 Tax=Tiliqua scincoides TaxID=71010 RepID=UPI003461AB8E
MAAPGLGLLLCSVVAAAASGGPQFPALSFRVCGDSCCAGSVRAGSAVAILCASRPDALLQGRCCLDAEGARGPVAVAGLDLGNCSLHRLCLDFPEASTAFVVDLTDNPLKHLPENAFQGFSQLETLVLPEELECPGGSHVWSNITIQESNRICRGPRNPCNGSEALALVCPENSLCIPDGPGLPQCLCVDPYHGYKCLRQGTFPYLPFYGTLGAVTAALSILFWFTQRHKAKSS